MPVSKRFHLANSPPTCKKSSRVASTLAVRPPLRQSSLGQAGRGWEGKLSIPGHAARHSSHSPRVPCEPTYQPAFLHHPWAACPPPAAHLLYRRWKRSAKAGSEKTTATQAAAPSLARSRKPRHASSTSSEPGAGMRWGWGGGYEV